MTPPNCYWAQQDVLLAGEYPGAKDAHVMRGKLLGLLDAGVTAFLDLTESNELEPYADTLMDLAKNRNMSCVYQRIPIRDMDVPRNREHMQSILAQIQTWNRQSRVVYVHCWGGVGRTGTVVGCQLVDSGMTGEAALERIAERWQGMSEQKRARHPLSPQTQAQRDFVRQWGRS